MLIIHRNVGQSLVLWCQDIPWHHRNENTLIVNACRGPERYVTFTINNKPLCRYTLNIQERVSLLLPYSTVDSSLRTVVDIFVSNISKIALGPDEYMASLGIDMEPSFFLLRTELLVKNPSFHMYRMSDMSFFKEVVRGFDNARDHWYKPDLIILADSSKAWRRKVGTLDTYEEMNGQAALAWLFECEARTGKQFTPFVEDFTRLFDS